MNEGIVFWYVKCPKNPANAETIKKHSELRHFRQLNYECVYAGRRGGAADLEHVCPEAEVGEAGEAGQLDGGQHGQPVGAQVQGGEGGQVGQRGGCQGGEGAGGEVERGEGGEVELLQPDLRVRGRIRAEELRS